MKKASYCLVILVVVACAAVIYVAHAGYWGLSLEKKIDAVSVATLTVTIVIAILVQYFFAITVSNRRAEKDLLLENGRDAIAALKACREAIDASTEGGLHGSRRKQVISHIRRLSNALEMLGTALEMSECRNLAGNISSIREEYLSYKGASTRAAPGKPYTVGDLADQEKAFNKLRKMLQSLMFEINRHE